MVLWRCGSTFGNSCIGTDRRIESMKKVDLHIHTVATVSDHYFEFSMDTLQSYVECKELDAIAVTNHNLFDRKQYEEICEKISVPVFPGIEIDVEQGHLLLITSPDALVPYLFKTSYSI